ncbi:hypothetical protein [Thermosulfurimonas sp. F29]|uniref:hypothetical protein n=1 Tax=Thermosulfurimonas sp. F29 TaxID=2867247 RepID=UPI001C82E133|nr:hypothetical protein [Thermosulfurimonas sp. F29]MBX6422063.1 hypothetical protein [Thermosulfurimonas sp. F29]
MRKPWLLLMILLLAGGPGWAFNFSASWQRTKSKGAPPQWSRNYTLSFWRDLTPAMNAGATVRYSHQSQADTWRKTWVPSVFFTLTNDLFSFNLSGTGTQSRTDSSPTMNSYNWSADLSTHYRKAKVGLYFNLGRQWNEAHPRTVDSKNHGWGFSLSRDFERGFFRNLSLNYSYRSDWNRDLVADSRSRNTSQVGRLTYSNRFYGISLALSQQYSLVKSEADYALGPGGQARVFVDLSFNGTPPARLDPAGNNTVVVRVGATAIKGIELYRDWINRISVPGTASWDIEYSSDGIRWTRLASGVSLPYRFSSSISSGYLRLTLVLGGAFDLPDPRARGFYFVTEGHVETRTRHYQGSLSLAYAFPRDIRTGYYFSYDITRPDEGAEVKRFNHSLSGSWNPSRYFRPRLTLSYSSDETEGQPKNETWSYSLGVSSDPLDTVSLSGAYTYNKAFTGGEATSETRSYGLGAQMELYPDLILKTNFSYSRNRTFGNSTSETTGFTTSWDLLARLKPTVTLDLRTDYTRSKASGGETSTTKRYSAILTWRVSSILSFNTYHILTDSGGERIYDYQYSFSLAATPRVRLSGGWNGSRNSTKRDSLSLNVSWNLGPHINFNSSYSWSKIDSRSSWTWLVNLNLVF